MLQQSNTAWATTKKVEMMLEKVKTRDIEKLQSTRILNTHLPLRYLPKKLEEKKTKILVVMRNPKDVSVSYYHMIRGSKRYDYGGQFKDFIVNFMEGKIPYGSWFDNFLEWENAMETKKYNIHVTFYEDLKENGPEEIKKISNFFGFNADDKLCQAISEACLFEKMKEEKQPSKELMEKNFRTGFTFYRKGQIGDWKNYFTVAENKAFDKIFEEKFMTSALKSNIKFKPSSK